MTKQCHQCSKTFTITIEDQAFYQRIAVPEPTLCPDCRVQRRMVWRNERTLYQRQCDLCKKDIVSIYDPKQPYIVYCYDCWYSDKWDAADYGQVIDFTRPFFDQFKELQLKVPRVYAMALDNENSEYTNGSAYNKDCYLIFVSDHNEDCLYSYGILNCVSSLDNLNVTKSELTYDCIGCSSCYDVQYSIDSSGCRNSLFLLDCKAVSDCFMSYGLRNVQYVWRNQQLTQAEYHAKLAKLQRGSYAVIQRLKTEFEDLKKKHTFKYYHGLNNENFSGDYLERCSNTFNSFESYELENCKYCIHGNKIKDSHDIYVVVDNSQLVYDVVSGIELYQNYFSYSYWHGSDGQYCDSIYYGKNLFGCVGLRHKNYHILNKPYPEPEYYRLRDKLIEHMSAKGSPRLRRVGAGGSASGGKETGEYGQFFPVTLSPFAYNETAAYDHFPLTKEAVLQRGWRWRNDDAKAIRYSTYRLPDTITAVKDDITEAMLTCGQCKKNYKIVPQELTFYRQQQVPIPRHCHDCRHRQRLHNRNPRHLWKRQCMCTQPQHRHSGQCPTQFETSYPGDSATIVYCESCYERTIV